jgi:hypothetical protein
VIGAAIATVGGGVGGGGGVPAGCAGTAAGLRTSRPRAWTPRSRPVARLSLWASLGLSRRWRARGSDSGGVASATSGSPSVATAPEALVAKPTSAGSGGGSGGSSRPGPTIRSTLAPATPAASLPTLLHRIRLRSIRSATSPRLRRAPPIPPFDGRYSHPPPMRSSRQTGLQAVGCKPSPAVVLGRSRAASTRRSLRPRLARLSLASLQPCLSR